MKLYFLLGTICYYIIIAIIKIAVIEVQLHYSFDNSPPKSIRKKRLVRGVVANEQKQRSQTRVKLPSKEELLQWLIIIYYGLQGLNELADLIEKVLELLS